MATGLGPKGQEGGAIPGCEVARWGLAQTLVGYLHCEESQPGGLVWNLPKPGGPGERPFSSWALLGPSQRSVPSCTLVRPGVKPTKTAILPSFPPVSSHPPTSRLCLF